MGRPTPASRRAFAVVAVVALAVVAGTLARLDIRLSSQVRANRETLQATRDIVAVNKTVTARLNQLSALTAAADTSLTETAALAPVLERLQVATARAHVLVAAGRAGTEASRTTLEEIRQLVTTLDGQAAAMVASSGELLTQQSALAAILRGIVGDLEGALADVRRVRQRLDLVPL